MLTFDSNLLIYAVDTRESEKRSLAQSVIGRASAADAFIVQQTLGEFFNICRKRRLLSAAAACRQVEAWMILFDVEPTSPGQLFRASELADRRRKQFWDMLIVRVAADAGATTLLTEDIGDGEVIEGVRMLNPFDPANAAEFDSLLTPSW